MYRTPMNPFFWKPFNKMSAVFSKRLIWKLCNFFLVVNLRCAHRYRAGLHEASSPKATQPGLIWKWKPLPAQHSSAFCLLWCIVDSGVEWVKPSTTQTLMDRCLDELNLFEVEVKVTHLMYSHFTFIVFFFLLVIKNVSWQNWMWSICWHRLKPGSLQICTLKKKSDNHVGYKDFSFVEKISGFGLSSSLFCSDINQRL